MFLCYFVSIIISMSFAEPLLMKCYLFFHYRLKMEDVIIFYGINEYFSKIIKAIINCSSEY